MKYSDRAFKGVLSFSASAIRFSKNYHYYFIYKVEIKSLHFPTESMKKSHNGTSETEDMKKKIKTSVSKSVSTKTRTPTQEN